MARIRKYPFDRDLMISMRAFLFQLLAASCLVSATLLSTPVAADVITMPNAPELKLTDNLGRPYFPIDQHVFSIHQFDQRTVAIAGVSSPAGDHQQVNQPAATRSAAAFGPFAAPPREFPLIAPPKVATPRSASSIMDAWAVGVFR